MMNRGSPCRVGAGENEAASCKLSCDLQAIALPVFVAAAMCIVVAACPHLLPDIEGCLWP